MDRTTSRSGRIALSVGLVSLVAGIMLAVPRAAHASCLPPPPVRTALSESDAAFVGRILDVTDAGEGGEEGPSLGAYTFEVERWVKGEGLPDRLVVFGPFGTSVDFEFEAPDAGRMGVFLRMDEGRLTSSGCSITDPDVLIAASEPIPAPNGEGPIRMLVTGEFDPIRIVALDSDGRVLGYGAGAGYVDEIALCPGSRYALEIAEDWFEGSSVLEVRDLRTMEIVRQVPVKKLVPTVDRARAGDVLCLDEDAHDLLIHVDGKSSAIVATMPEVHTVAEGTWSEVHLAAEHAVTVDRRRTTVSAIDLATGRAQVILEIPQEDEFFGDTNSIEVSPAGDRVAIAHWNTDEEHFLRLVDLDDGTLVETPIPFHDDADIVRWDGDDAVVLVALNLPHDVGTVRRYSAQDLSVLDEWEGWNAFPEAIIDGQLFGFGGIAFHEGTLMSAPIEGGEAEPVLTLPGSNAGTVVAVDGSTRVAGEAAQVPSTDMRTVPALTSLPASAIPGADRGYLFLGLVVMTTIGVLVMVLAGRARGRRGRS